MIVNDYTYKCMTFIIGMSIIQQLTFMLAVILATIFIISLVFNQTVTYYRILEKARKFGKKPKSGINLLVFKNIL